MKVLKKTYVVVYYLSSNPDNVLTQEVQASSNIDAESQILRNKEAYIYRSFIKGEED